MGREAKWSNPTQSVKSTKPTRYFPCPFVNSERCYAVVWVRLYHFASQISSTHMQGIIGMRMDEQYTSSLYTFNYIH